jgi:hypothetical protein
MDDVIFSKNVSMSVDTSVMYQALIMKASFSGFLYRATDDPLTYRINAYCLIELSELVSLW